MITFETKCWQNDYRLLLEFGLLEKLLRRSGINNFDRVNLIINNVEDRKKVKLLADKKKVSRIITDYYFVDDYIKDAFSFFNIDDSIFGKGLLYSTAEVVGFYLNTSKYLFHLSSDSIPEKNIDFSWYSKAIHLFQNIENICVANLTWNNLINEVLNESLYTKNDFSIGFGFSDQCYLLDIDKLKYISFNETNIASERFPIYGGDLFEKRVDAWMRNNNKYRATYLKGSYIHKNIPKNILCQLGYLIS